MSVIEVLIASYLSVGFAKFVLDISQLPFFYQLVSCVDCKLAEERGSDPGFRVRLLLVVSVGIAVQSWLLWPQILRFEGLRAFVQPINKQRAAEIVGLPFGLEFEFEDN